MAIKESTFDSLVRYYEKIGDIKKFTLVCHAMVKDKESTPAMRGEIAETVLYVMLQDFIEKNSLTDWRLSKGMILKDPDNYSNGYLTELDLTLFTPKCIFSFECKSYKGEKYLTERGTLNLKKGEKITKVMDVFDQHSKHFNMLYTNLECALKKDADDKKYKSFKLLYFDFADMPTEDKREKLYSRVFPIVNVKNLYSLFKDYDSRPTYWNMYAVNKVVDVIEKNKKKNTKNHLNYVTNLHGNTPSKR